MGLEGLLGQLCLTGQFISQFLADALSRNEMKNGFFFLLLLPPDTEFTQKIIQRNAECLLKSLLATLCLSEAFKVFSEFAAFDALGTRRQQIPAHEIRHGIRMKILFHQSFSLFQIIVLKLIRTGRFCCSKQFCFDIHHPFIHWPLSQMTGQNRAEIIRRSFFQPEQRLFIRIAAATELILNLMKQLMPRRTDTVCRCGHHSGPCIDRRQSPAPACPAAGKRGNFTGFLRTETKRIF